MGINTLVDQNFSTTPPSRYGILKPRIEKSIALNFNLVDEKLSYTEEILCSLPDLVFQLTIIDLSRMLTSLPE